MFLAEQGAPAPGRLRRPLLDLIPVRVFVEQEQVGDLGQVPRGHDIGFGQQERGVLFLGDEEQVLPLGDVQQDLRRDLVEAAEHLDGPVEIALFLEIAPGKQQVADRAIGEVERPPA